MTVSCQAPLRLVLAQLGRLISPEPGAPPPGDPKFLPADVREESIVKANRNQKKFKWIAVLLIIFAIALITGMFLLISRLLHY